MKRICSPVVCSKKRASCSTIVWTVKTLWVWSSSVKTSFGKNCPRKSTNLLPSALTSVLQGRIAFQSFLLVPFDRAQTQDYIHSHMRYVGETREIFSPSAIDAIFSYSGGVARKINKVCSLSLLYASQKSMHSIDGSIINFVVDQELSW